MSEPEKKQKIEITVDNKGTEKLVEILEKERKEKEEKEKGKTELSLNDIKIQAVQKFGRPDLFLCANSKEELSDSITSYINEIANKGKQAPSGSAPLNPEQYGQKKEDLYTKKYSSYHEMIDELLDTMHNGTPIEQANATSYYEAILKKWVLEKKRNANVPEAFYDPNLPENLPELKELSGFKVPVRKEEGDIGKILLAWKKQREKLLKGEQA